jgi:uncharacterized protein
MKKRKSRGRKKKISVLILVVLPLALTCCIAFFLYHSLTESLPGIFSPVYEELYSSSADLKGDIKNIDYAIYEALLKSGINDQDVVFLNVQPRHEKGYIWDYAELLVKCRDKQCALNLFNNINHALAKSDKEITLHKKKEIESELIFNVLVKSLITHKLILTVQEHPPITKDVRPRIAIIIDDLGYDAESNLPFFRLDLPLSLSVLPNGPSTKSIVRMANEEGRELVLHLPMEPRNYPSVKPGPGALLLSMNADEITRVLDQDLRQIKGARGVNNHMGSAFTEDREKMRIVLAELKKKGLFFVDSRTTKLTVALDLAREIGLPSDRRTVFLDNNLAPKAMKIQMERLLSMARNHGLAIGIGHPYKETLRLLKEYCSKIKSEFQMVPVSELMG